MLRTRVMAGRYAGVVLATILASVLATVYSIDLMIPAWRVRAGAPAPVTLRMPLGPEVQPIADPSGSILGVDLDGRLLPMIIPRRSVPSGELGSLAEAYEARRRPVHWRFALGLWSVYFLTSLMMFTYLRRFTPSQGRLLRTHLGLLGLIITLAIVAKATLLFTPLWEYYIPVGTVPLWAALYIDRRAALLLNISLAFLISSFAGFDVTLIAIFLARGITAALVFRDRKHPRGMVGAGIVGGFAGALMLLACRFFFLGEIDVVADLHAGYRSSLAACVAGGVIGGLICWLFQQPAGTALGAVSRAQLVDLNDLDSPLLKKMAAEAPGSWQHARAMANLAEDAAQAIGADALLTRSGAYYHDLGKTIQSQYFVENLGAGERSPHEDLEPDVSADVIMSHVVGGTKILRDAGIPEPVVEFAYTHHGTSVIEYFWHKCQQQGNPKGLTQDAFRYPGMKPHTRETAILMLVDSIEAASRTIDPPDRDKFEEMIQRVIFTKMKQGQLDEAGLTVEDLRVLVTSLAETLVKVYHHRIKYPWQRPGGPQPVPAEPESPVPPAPATAPPPAAATPALAPALDAEKPDGKASATTSAENRAESVATTASAGEPQR